MEGHVFFELAKCENFATENAGAVNLFADLLNADEWWPSMRSPFCLKMAKIKLINQKI